MGGKRRVPTKLAKLERPRTEGLYERGRLFALLDRARGKPVIWISAPPGAGKTSQVASYVRARELPGLWYQVDGGDADICEPAQHASALLLLHRGEIRWCQRSHLGELHLPVLALGEHPVDRAAVEVDGPVG